MKSITKQIVVSLMLLTSVYTIAQDDPKPYLDTIKIEFENKLEINLSMHNCNNFGADLYSDINGFKEVMQKVDFSEYNYKNYNISYVPNKTMLVREKPPVDKIIIKQDTIIKSDLNNQSSIIGEDYTMQINFKNVQDVLETNLNKQIQTVLDSLPEKTKWASSYNYSFENNELSYNKHMDKVNGGMDILELKGSVGVNLINNQPLTDITAEIGTKFNKKGLFKNNYYISYNSLGLIDANNNISINGFANIGYRYNLSNNRDKPNWVGVELGYLTNRNGNFFDKNTFKIGANWQVAKSISVTPQLFFSPDGNLLSPSVRIGFGF